MVKRLKIFFKNIYFKFKSNNIKIGKNTNISIDSRFEGYNTIGTNSEFNGFLGLGSYIGKNCLIDGTIGRFCSISDNVKIIYYTHPTKDFVSTSPSFYSLKRQNNLTFTDVQKFDEAKFANVEKTSHVIIGNDVWIGYGAIILGGVSIGDGAIIGAGSIVTKNVDSYSVVVGSPAKEIKKRFSNEQIIKLNKFKWWDMPIEWIRDNSVYFSDISKFEKIIDK